MKYYVKQKKSLSENTELLHSKTMTIESLMTKSLNVNIFSSFFSVGSYGFN